MEHKFRAWAEITTKQWITENREFKKEYRMLPVHSIHFGTEKVMISSEFGVHSLPYSQVIIMQFTGLRDRKRTKKFPKGQEICEGDIVKVDRQDSFPSYNQAIVVYAENHGAFLLQYTKETNPKGILSKESISSKNGKTIFDYCTGWKLEVIGNIYENPELLKGTS